MREIKFRAWDKKKKNMNYTGVFDEYDDGFERGNDILCLLIDGTLAGYTTSDGGKDGLWEHEVDIKDRFILTQFTGLLDKNRKEIYEGDIVKRTCNMRHYAECDGIKEEIYEVSYDGIRLFPFCETSEYMKEFEVIGNIYENPELLEEKK